jgi:hypothetical protein
MQRYGMAKPPIEYRPSIRRLSVSRRPEVQTMLANASQTSLDALEAYKAAERAKVLKRVHKHRAKKAGK